MKKSSANNSSLLFLAFVLGVVIIGIAPGFAFMYWVLESSFEAAVICGALVGLFGWLTLNLLLGMISILRKK
jgi:hypothetical protein